MSRPLQFQPASVGRDHRVPLWATKVDGISGPDPSVRPSGSIVRCRVEWPGYLRMSRPAGSGGASSDGSAGPASGTGCLRVQRTVGRETFGRNDPVGWDGSRAYPLGFILRANRTGKPIEAGSGSNPWLCLDRLGWEIVAKGFRVNGSGWNSPGGVVIVAHFPSG